MTNQMRRATLAIIGCSETEIDSERWSPHWFAQLADYEASKVDFAVVAFSDELDEGSRCEIAQQAKAAGRRTVLLSHSTAPESYAMLLECGADTLVPADQPELLLRVATREFDVLQRQSDGELPQAGPFVGESPKIRQACEQITAIAVSDAPVLVTGESGSGKELAARAIHRLSPRRYQPLVSINCGAIPSDLVESHLFGHERGAFTGADTRHIGCFERAHGGTLFLDEVGELDLNHQVDLLRVLEEGRIRRVGGEEDIAVDVRIVTATNRDLASAVESGTFRQDLYYRLNVLRLSLPPLRERPTDIPLLWDHFVRAAAEEEGSRVPASNPGVMERLQKHRWPGNVRELENAARSAVAMRPTGSLTPAGLPAQLCEPERSDELRVPGMTLDELERAAIMKTYEVTGSVRQTAELLDVSERKIWYRLKQYREEESDAELASRPSLALVEDDADLRSALSDLLAPSYVVAAYRSADDFLNTLQFEEPDLVVSDIRMPGGSGIELLAEMRTRGCNTPVILVSAYADEPTRRRAMDGGALAVLDKPIDAIALGRYLERAAEVRA